MIQAKQVELQKWKDMEVYEEIEDQGQNFISTRWVITEKICEGQKGAKARLVARGFEDSGTIRFTYSCKIYTKDSSSNNSK